MSVLDQVKKLEEQKQALLKGAHDDLLGKAQTILDELNELGYKYRISGGTIGSRSTGSRRSGIRQNVLSEIKKHGGGISRKDLLAAMGADDKSSTQSVSNAISALKKAGSITADNGVYAAT